MASITIVVPQPSQTAELRRRWSQLWVEVIRRRTLLAGLALAPAIGRAAASSFGDRLVGAIIARLDATSPGPALLASYPDRTANAAFARFAPANDPAAYTYDNALAGLALLAGGHALHAARIADALERAQAHDPNYSDGRLRNAYRAGPVDVPVALPGWWDAEANLWAEDPYQVGSETGPIAWAILLWTALRDAGVNSDRYNVAAARAGDWIVSNCRTAHGFSGGVFGFPPQQETLTWVSTEQNTDCAVAFQRLHRPAEAAHAANFVRSMRNKTTGLYDAGLTPAGMPNKLIAADANLWPWLAGLGGSDVMVTLLAALGSPRARPIGIGFSEAGAGIWNEGAGFAIMALQRAGRQAEAARFFESLHGQVAEDGFLYTTPSPMIATGLKVGPGAHAEAFNYYRVPALSPTAWAALAALRVNPLKP